MEPITAGIIGTLCMMVLIILGTHIGPSLAAGGLLGLVLLFGDLHRALGILTTTPYSTVAVFALSILPLIILMGILAKDSGLTEAAYNAAYKWLWRLPGGIAIATTWACAAFGAACGSSVATAAIFTKVSLPEMKKAGYQLKFSCGSIAAGGTLGMLIPPSALGIIYGILTEQSIAKIFIAGIGPGILLSIIFSTGIYILTRRNPKLAPRIELHVSWSEKITSLVGLWGIGVLAVVVLGGIYTGVFTATEAAAIGCFAAFLMFMISKKRSYGALRAALLETGRTNAMVFMILIGAMIFSRMLALTGITGKFIDLVSSSGLRPMVIFWIFMLMYLVMGCFFDSISIMSITLPAVFPLMMSFGFDPIWFGMVLIVNIEAGLLTPPVGLNVYVVKAAAGDGISLEEVFAGCLPFFFMVLVCLILIVYIPAIITWLPSMMFPTASG
jgi:tripartite ATP-independent transporter DctM subunit